MTLQQPLLREKGATSIKNEFLRDKNRANDQTLFSYHMKRGFSVFDFQLTYERER